MSFSINKAVVFFTFYFVCSYCDTASTEIKKEVASASQPETDPDRAACERIMIETLKGACGGFPINIDFANTLIDNAPEELKDIIETIEKSDKCDSEIFKGLPKELIPSRLLLIGEPGVGKSSLALAITIRLKRDYYYVRMPMLGNEYKDSEKHALTVIITAALSKNKPLVIILDEINLFAEKKTYDGTADTAVGTLWLLLDKCAVNPNILVIGTCNDATKLPPQMKDRFEGHIVEIPNIDAEGRLKMLEKSFEQFEDRLSYQYIQQLAKKTYSFSPRQLQELVHESVRNSFLRNGYVLITKEDIEKAYEKFKRGSGLLNAKSFSIRTWLKENASIVYALQSTLNLSLVLAALTYSIVNGRNPINRPVI